MSYLLFGRMATAPMVGSLNSTSTKSIVCACEGLLRRRWRISPIIEYAQLRIGWLHIIDDDAV